TLTGVPRIRLPPASIRPLRRPNGEDSHPSRHSGASWRTQEQSTAVSPLLGAVQRGSPTLSAPERRLAKSTPSLCKQDVGVRVSRTVLQRLLVPPQPGATVSVLVS